MVSPLHSSATMAAAIANDPSLVGVARTPAPVSDQAVTSWLQSNPGATDATIASAMQQYGVTPAQMARVTGLDTGAVQARYDAALPVATNFQTVANTGGLGSLGIGTNVDYSGSNVNLARAPASDVLTSAAGTGALTDIGAITGLTNNVGASDQITGSNATTLGTNNNVLGGLILAGDSFLSRESNVGEIAAQTGQKVTNVARGGFTTTDVINQLNGFIDSGGTFAPGSTIMLNLGGNDLLGGINPATVEKNLNQLISTLDDLGVKVILSGASDVGSVADVTGSTNLVMSNIYNNVAAKNPNVTLVDAMSGLLNQKNLVTEDGFHLTAPGQTAFTAALSNAYLNSIGKGGISYTDQAIKDFAKTAGLSLEQALALAPYFKISEDRVRSALGGETELYKKFGITGGTTAPTTEGILSGFKYANDSGMSEASLKKTLGEDVFNTYKKGFSDYAKTGIANILADKQLSFDEARTAVKFGRDYGYDAQELADLTGTDKRVFDAIFKNYNDRTNQIVDSVLGAEDVKTNGDRIQRALALQNQYGFTDEDLAKATDFSLDQVKGFLDPVRNYEADFKKLVQDPDLSEDKTKAFLTTALQNPFIKEKLGDKLQPALDELNRPPRERILDQIERQRDVLGAQRYRGVFGDPEVMADVLERKGVKSLADLGRKDKFEATPAEKRYFAPDGTPVEDLGNGTFGVMGSEGGYGPTFSKSQVQTVYGRTESTMNPDGESSTSRFIEIPKSEIDKDGNYQQKVGTVVVNKRTGKELTDTDHKLAVQSSSGGLRKKSNSLNVGFDKNGNAVLMASSERAGLGGLVQDLAPMISMALPFVLPGLGAGLSSMLPGAGAAATATSAAVAPTLMNQALTQGIIGGGLTTLGGGQFEKGFLGGAVNPFINAGINSLLPTGLSENAANAIRGAGTNVIRGALQGESFGDLLGQGVLSGLTNYGLNTALGSSGLTPQQLNFATGIALPLLQGQKVSPINLMTTLASASQQQPKGRTP